jgi:hypothetical protein
MRRLEALALFVTVVAACSSSTHGDPTPVVSITSPEFEFHGTGPVVIQVVVQGCDPGTVELLADGETLAILVPPFQYSWDTTWAREGRRVVTARASCDGATGTSAPVSVYVDRTPPTIAGREPAPGSADVLVRDPISVTFSEPVDLASALGKIVLRKGGIVVPSNLRPSADGARLLIEPATPPVAGETLSVEVAAGVRDLARLPLEAGTSWTFSYPMLVQPAHRALSALSSYWANAPSLAVDAVGEPVAAWRPDFTLSLLMFAPDGTPVETTAPVPYGHDCGLAVRGTDVYLVDSSTVVPDASTGLGSYQIRFLKPEGGAFVAGPAVTSGASPGFDPEISFAPDGTPVVFWLEEGPGFTPPQVLRAAFLDGGTWSDRGTPTLNQDGTQSASSLAVARDAHGTPAVAFSENLRVYVKAWTGAGWSLVGGGQVAGAYGAPAIAFDGNDPYVALVDGTNPVRVYHQWVDAWTQIPGDPRRDRSLQANTPAIAVSGPGRFFLAWTEGSSGASLSAGNLYLSEWNGSAWVPVGDALNRDAAHPAYAPALAIDARGDPVVLWTELEVAGTWNLRLARANR